MTRHRFVLGLTVAALVVAIPGVPGMVRAIVAVAFFCLGPGLAWAPWLPVKGPVEKAAVAVALSIALDVLVAVVMLRLGLPDLFPAALALVAITVLGLRLTPRVDVPA